VTITPTIIKMTRPETDAGFAAGIRLFNQGRFFEAHEVWEELWKTAEGDKRIFYQGIIQAAAALVHMQRGNYKGGISVYLKSRPKLDQFPVVWMGIELGQFRSELARYFGAVHTSFSAMRGGCVPRGTGRIRVTGRTPLIRSVQIGTPVLF
jgi:uncharacterized protein